MKQHFIFFASLITFLSASSQNSSRITVKEGTSVKDHVSFRDRYCYPEFVNGTVFFKDGTAHNARLNYNLYSGQLQFVNRSGDTLEVANENSIKAVAVGQDSFYYDKGYYRLLSGSDGIKLAVQQRLTVVDNQKIGAFGQPTSGAGIETVDRVVQTNKLALNQNTILANETKYFIGNRFNQFVPFTRKGLMKMFSNRQNEIKKYLDERSVDFNRQEDLTMMLAFLQTLST